MPRTAKKINNKSHDKTEQINDSSLIDLSNTNIKKLLKKGKEKKILSWDEINKAIPEGSLSSDQIEDLHASIDQLGITIVDKDDENEEITDKESEDDVAVAGNLNDETGRTDDPVRMYLKEMGSVDLLTRQGEVDLSIKIEDGKNKILQSIYEFPFVYEYFSILKKKIVDGEVYLRNVIDLEKKLKALLALTISSLNYDEDWIIRSLISIYRKIKSNKDKMLFNNFLRNVHNNNPNLYLKIYENLTLKFPDIINWLDNIWV